jgi:hypothetical protein
MGRNSEAVRSWHVRIIDGRVVAKFRDTVMIQLYKVLGAAGGSTTISGLPRNLLGIDPLR